MQESPGSFSTGGKCERGMLRSPRSQLKMFSRHETTAREGDRERESEREREREKSRKRVGSSFATRFSSLGWSLLFALSVLEPQTAAANGANLRQLEARG